MVFATRRVRRTGIMRGKRFISTLLLTVYLLAVSGAAWASLSCDCVTMHARTAHVHSCRCHCSCHHHVRAAHDAPADGVSLTAPCCDDRHSTEIELYTAALSGCGAVRTARGSEIPQAGTGSARRPGPSGSLSSALRAPRPSRIGLEFICDGDCSVRNCILTDNGTS